MEHVGSMNKTMTDGGMHGGLGQMCASLLEFSCFPRLIIPREKLRNRRESSSLGNFVGNIFLG
jgi:hypothetical protein